MLSLVAERMKQTEEFAGSNYYGRLLQTFDIDGEFHDRVGRDFRKQTPLLWSTLNRWLEDSNGRRGLPTAVAFDRRRFIGLPLSQALVRAQDRTKLPVLFAQFGLQPGQRISVQAMQELFGEWMPRSQVTRSLERLWSKQSNRERISEVVCAELEGWDGALPRELRPAEHKLDDNLFVAAELRAHPRAAIELLLVARHGGQGAARSAVLSANASGAAMTALGRLGDRMRLQPVPRDLLGVRRARRTGLLPGTAHRQCLARGSRKRSDMHPSGQEPGPAEAVRGGPSVHRSPAGRAAGDLSDPGGLGVCRPGTGVPGVECAEGVARAGPRNAPRASAGLDRVPERAAGTGLQSLPRRTSGRCGRSHGPIWRSAAGCRCRA